MNDTHNFNLHVSGLGYLNRIREVTPRKGEPFLCCDIAAFRGEARDADHTWFDCRVRGKEEQTLVRRCINACEQKRKVLIQFRLGDLYADTFVYSKGERKGATGVSLKAQLLHIRLIKIDGEEVYQAETKARLPEQETPELPFLSTPSISCSRFTPRDLTDHAMLRDATRPGGSLLYWQDQQDQGFWYLLSGVIGLYHSLNNGKEVLVRVYQGEGWFGFTGLFGKPRHHCHARVMQEAHLCHIVPHHPPTFLQHYPAFRQYLLEQMANSLADAEHRMTWIARHRSRERVLGSLWYLTQYFPGYEWTWREVAEFAGCETETALRVSKEVRRAGILDGSQRRLHVLYPERLAALLDTDITLS